MAVDLIEQRGLTSRKLLLEVFRNLPVGRGEQLSALVDHIVAGVEDPDVRKAFDVACVVRRFDARVLAGLLTPPGESPADSGYFAAIVDALGDYSFTESCSADARKPAVWRFSEFIRLERDHRLASTDPGGYEQLHQRAAAHFAQRMYEEDQARPDETSYARTLRHDAPEWQSLEREWLYHIEHLHDRRSAGIALATMYLLVFYWYGWYQPYSLCKQLLDDWERTQRADEDGQWLAVLQDFSSSYPIVWTHQEADWDAVEEVMSDLRCLGGVNGEPSVLKPDQRRLRALTDLFIAQSRLRRIPADYSGIQWYEEARRLLLEFPQDHWLLPWVAFWIGQSSLEKGDLQTASNECEAALQLGMQQGDDEAVASAWQFRGDIRWHRGDFKRAIRAYLLAIYTAFRFLKLPEPPDSYTRAFYQEICDGTVNRVWALWRLGEEEAALQACTELRDGMTGLRQSLGCTDKEADFRGLLEQGDHHTIDTALLLDLPPQNVLTHRIAVRHALNVLAQLIRSLQEDEAVSASDSNENQPVHSSEDKPQRLRWDLGLRQPGG